MSSNRIGERFLTTRGRLADVMHGVVSLAAETTLDLGERLPLEELKTGLGSPFQFIVCGEVNSGKSTLLNALCGQELCPVNHLPVTKRVHHYRYGSSAQDAEASPLLKECERPVEFLRNFHLIDTPGTNAEIEGYQAIASRYFPTADLIFFVFAVSNPWSAATWNWVSELSRDDLERVVFIVQQADQRAASDVHVILGHMADLAMKRMGMAPPVFAVSAKLACEAKRATPMERDGLRASGMTELESFISQRISQSPARRHQLEIWRSQAASALYALEDHIEQQSHSIGSHDRFLETIEREIGDIRERFVVRLPSHLASVAEIFESEARWVTKRLRSSMGVIPSFFRLFTGDRTGPKIEAVFIERLQAAVESVAEQDGVEVVDFCRNHWNELGERVKAEMALDLKSSDPLDESLAASKALFVQRLGGAARQGIGYLKVRNQLDKEIRRRNRAIKSFISTALVLTTAGATCGALKIHWLPEIFCASAGLFLVGGILTSMITRKSIIADFQHRLLDTCSSFANTLRSDYEEALRVVFKDYAACLSIVRTHLARERLALEPRLRRWQELFLTLKAIEQEL